MVLAPGSRVGPYEIVSAIGEGGMGEVFRARTLRTKTSGTILNKVSKWGAAPRRGHSEMSGP